MNFKSFVFVSYVTIYLLSKHYTFNLFTLSAKAQNKKRGAFLQGKK